ncbi:SusC/RagA family TonB-linked outer membrane protein [Chitinophaga sp. SYP-B3965]|uniref:SusC/RagA family TonB-linked outer membrane protein n=1 Tax=Chitinophaga sp. SYP-B3965 TaxID=2663120 RepID=UPI001565E510|nr:SusC/RagA family TonB-linked outer membrane protein [Chitinophaga sp. SYP-B3965]
MKLTIFFLTTVLVHAYASGSAQTVTLSGKDLPLKQVFTAIEKQTGYVVLSSKDLIASRKSISLDAYNLQLNDLLNIVLKDIPFKYDIQGKTIFISRKPATSPPATFPMLPPVPPLNIKVINRAGVPLSGASVVNKKKRRSGITDATGMLHLDVSPGDVIEVSYIGYETRSVPVTETLAYATSLIIQLEPSVTVLENVQVVVNTGYQRIRPEQSTGAISQITTKEYESQISTDFLSGLNGKVSGLLINNDIKFNSTVNGVPSSKSLFNIRGISTITGNQNPLIVIDGFPTELSLSMIDPNEIKSITILKDAAAATVYGVRASNGVIVIERKKATAGHPRMNFRATTSFTPADDYTRYRWAKDGSAINVGYDQDINKNSIDATTWNRLNTSNSANAETPAYYIMAQQAASIITPDQASRAFDALKDHNNSAEYGKLFQRTASIQNYHLDVSGGSSNATYYFTANYARNKLAQINNDNNRIILSGRTTLQLSERLSAELMTDYQENRENAAPVPDINSIYPYERLQDANGKPMPIISGSTINPFYNKVMMDNGLLDYLYYPMTDVHEINDRTRSTSNRTTLNFNYKLLPGITVTLGGIYEGNTINLRHNASERSSEAHQYIDSYVTQNTDGSLVFNIPKGGFLREQNTKTSSYTIRAQLNYDKTIGKDHAINGIAGAEVRNLTQQGSSAAYFGYNDETLLQQPINYDGIANSTIIGSFVNRRNINYANLFDQLYTEDRFVSGYSNIVYTYKRRYSLTGSIRIDQSNLFGTDPKYRYKPLWSVGGAWNIANEHFMQGAPWLKQLKLRAAYGFNGNVAKLSLPQVIAQSYLNTYTTPYSDALRLFANANSGLRWEQTKNVNVGLDYGILDNVSGSIDFYHKNSTDLLASGQIDPTIGTSPSFINNASINNQGMEITLRSDWIKKANVNWNTGFVLSYNTSKVLKIYQNLTLWPSSTNAAGYVEGQPVGALYAYRYAGLDANGMPMVRDDKGNTSSSLNYDNTSAAFYYTGTSIPTTNIGLSNRLDIGNFYFYCMVSYYGGFKVQVPRADPAAFRPLDGAGNYWKAPGDEKNPDAVMALAGFNDFFAGMVYRNADNYVVKGNYVTIRDITASYTFNNSLFLKRIGMNHFEVKLQASNVWTRGLNKYNYSMATGSYAKPYITPTYSAALFTNF